MSTFQWQFCKDVLRPPESARLSITCWAPGWTNKCRREPPCSASGWGRYSATAAETCIRSSQLSVPAVWHAPWHRGAEGAERVAELAPAWTRSRLLFDLMVMHFLKPHHPSLSLATAPSPSLSQTLASRLTFSSGSTGRGCWRYKSTANEAPAPGWAGPWLFYLPACFEGRNGEGKLYYIFGLWHGKMV